MRLVDGQVMDFVKGNGPYVDERFGQPNLLTGQTADVTVEAPVQPLLPVTFQGDQVLVGDAPAADDRLADIRSALAESEASGRGVQSMSISQWQINNVPQQPLQPQLQPSPNSIPFPPPWTPYAPVSAPSDMNALRDRVQARIDTLESLDDRTPEMNATIKALKWVIDDIAKSTFSDRTIP